MKSARSRTVTQCPARLSCWAAASPAGPEPTTATFLSVRSAGGSGLIQPLANPRSEISFSMYSMVTGSWLMARTQEPSQGAGQMRPVNSGKLLVLRRMRVACSQLPRKTWWLNSGMTFPRGQPMWQKGTAQSMQRAPCSLA